MHKVVEAVPAASVLLVANGSGEEVDDATVALLMEVVDSTVGSIGAGIEKAFS